MKSFAFRSTGRLDALLVSYHLLVLTWFGAFALASLMGTNARAASPVLDNAVRLGISGCPVLFLLSLANFWAFGQEKARFQIGWVSALVVAIVSAPFAFLTLLMLCLRYHW